MNYKGFANIVLIILVVVLAGALGYFVLIKKPAPSPTVSQETLPPPTSYAPESTSSTSSISSEKSVISLGPKLPISFELPKGYAVFQQEGFEGGYGTTIFVGKEVRSGHWKYAPLQIDFSFDIYDAQRERTYQPREYIEVVFGEQEKNYAANPKYVQLLGNKAVRYTSDADGTPIIIGYLRADQLPNLSKEYLVMITSGTYGSGTGFNKELFDTAIDSLQVIK